MKQISIFVKVIEEKARVRASTAPDGLQSTLVIDRAKRDDSGDYALTLKNDSGMESVTFNIRVIGALSTCSP